MRFYLQRASRTMNALQHICYDIHMNKDKKMGLNSVWNNNNNKENDDDFLHEMIIPLGCRGGALLNMLQKHIDTSGEKHVRILYNKLLRASCLPYFNMLSNWIYRGIITDIYGEFMIQEKTHLKKEDVAQEYNNEYWTGRYSLNRLQIPSILYDYKDIIVTTGKYLNVMRESGFLFENNEKRHDLSKCSGRELGQYKRCI